MVAGRSGAARRFRRSSGLRSWLSTLLVAGPAAGALLGACSGSGSDSNSPEGANDAATQEASLGQDQSVPEAAPEEASAPEGSADGGAEGSLEAGTGAIGCAPDGSIPDDLACTGLYSDWSARTIAPDVTPYTPALVFWSDGAVKTRWIYLPPGSQIDTTDMDNWVFPVGTKIWKQFVLDGALIETRLIWKADATEWTFLDYRWSADGTTARRLDVGEKNVNGTTYEIPGTSMCSQCHGGRTDRVLGVDLLGTGAAGAQGVTLAGLATAGRLTHAPPATTVAIPEDSTGKAAAALGFLHVNCGEACHNGNQGAMAAATGLALKLTAEQLLPSDGAAPSVKGLDSYKTAVGVPAHLQPNGHPYVRIAAGDPSSSLLYLMASTRDADSGFIQMPPIVSHVPDTAGLGLVSDWIRALASDAGADH